jgi:hypothetical protein
MPCLEFCVCPHVFKHVAEVAPRAVVVRGDLGSPEGDDGEVVVAGDEELRSAAGASKSRTVCSVVLWNTGWTFTESE